MCENSTKAELSIFTLISHLNSSKANRQRFEKLSLANKKTMFFYPLRCKATGSAQQKTSPLLIKTLFL